MAGKRKRKRHCGSAEDSPRKRLQAAGSYEESRSTGLAGSPIIKHPVLSLYYPRVVTLRQYLLHQLPASSKARRRRLVAVGSCPEETRSGSTPCGSAEGLRETRANGADQPLLCVEDRDRALACLLDLSLVCGPEMVHWNQDQSRVNDLATFSQQQLRSTGGSSFRGNSCSQSEIVDFVIWQLYCKRYGSVYKPPHLLCHGYRRASIPRRVNLEQGSAAIPGLIYHFPNNHVNILKGPGWTELLGLLGKEGERLMLDLIMDNDIFVAAKAGLGNYYQLSGVPLSERQPLQKPLAKVPTSSKTSRTVVTAASGVIPEQSAKAALHAPGGITFVRSRMLYARGALNAEGKVRFGLRHIHVLNRFPDFNSPEHTVHVMMYIFPRQFGLHNVFTSTVDSKDTVQPFKDYTLREQEIAQHGYQKGVKKATREPSNLDRRKNVPKRLRGAVQSLTSKMQKMHGRCAYTELLRHYCPDMNNSCRPPRMDAVQDSQCNASTQSRTQTSLHTCTLSTGATEPLTQQVVVPKQAITDFATPTASVSAFCRAVLSGIVPNDFWGSAEDHNKEIIMRNIDRFINLRRFESLTLHEVVQGMKIRRVPWLEPPGLKPDLALSKSDLDKRTEIYSEFIYYIFDSLVIPLIRSNFHVTESSAHRNRLFFFRHDVWRSLSEPAMAKMKLSMFEEMKMEKARSILDARTLGFSQIRLLPKETGVRPIMNLRRRLLRTQNGRMMLGRSVNSVMGPVFSMLSFEKVNQLGNSGSALFSVGDMYPKVQQFKDNLQRGGSSGKTLFFAKVDVQSCFDSIPQHRVLRVVEKLVSEDEYSIARHAEIKAPNSYNNKPGAGPPGKPARKFVAKARAVHDLDVFEDVVDNELAVRKKNTIFVDSVVRILQDKDALLDLLEEHVERNVVKIGKKFYRQKEGIPQGSVLSTLLCSFFYGELEKECLDFLTVGDSLLLRLIDDFLLITTERKQARRFLQVMHDGVEKYGVQINPAKSLVNFEITVNGTKIPRILDKTHFPYCGNTIDTRSLNITKDRERRRNAVASDSLTVDYSKVPGKTFHRKVLDSFKIQAHAMFLDTSFNSLSTVLSNIYQSLLETATKFHHYLKCLPSGKQPQSRLLIGIFSDLVDLAFSLAKTKGSSSSVPTYQCAISKPTVKWLASMAFRYVLGRKQSRYGEIIVWLDAVIENSRPKGASEKMRMRRIVREGNQLVQGFKC